MLGMADDSLVGTLCCCQPWCWVLLLPGKNCSSLPALQAEGNHSTKHPACLCCLCLQTTTWSCGATAWVTGTMAAQQTWCAECAALRGHCVPCALSLLAGAEPGILAGSARTALSSTSTSTSTETVSLTARGVWVRCYGWHVLWWDSLRRQAGVLHAVLVGCREPC